MSGNMKESLAQIYAELLKGYGKQNWWPIINSDFLCEYRGGAPKDDEERFEIAVGAILTQNTAWANVEKALINLKKLNAINPKTILSLDEKRLLEAIKPAGYYNQKARKLKIFSKFYISLKGKTPSREELLSVWGVGPETADSILLYAYAQPIFVVDAYTKRIFSRIGLFKENSSYNEIQDYFHKNFRKDAKKYNEYHALIVEHAKRHCKKKKACDGCVMGKECMNSLK